MVIDDLGFVLRDRNERERVKQQSPSRQFVLQLIAMFINGLVQCFVLRIEHVADDCVASSVYSICIVSMYNSETAKQGSPY